MLADDGAAWGALTLLRRDDQRAFAPAETALVASLRPLAEGIRRAVLLDEPQPDAADGAAAGPARARRLGRHGGRGVGAVAGRARPRRRRRLPAVVRSVAGRARSIAAGRAADGAIARARVRTGYGSWLVVRGSTLGDGPDALAAVMLEPAGPHDLAPLRADAYELTPRERAVTELVAYGLATGAIARRLHLSPWTVQDHLKSIFEKVGVTTRGELVARVFFEQRAPELS